MRAIDLFQINYQRAVDLLDAHKGAFPKGRPTTKGTGDDLLRSVVVFAVAALDAYLGMKVVQVTNEIIFKRKRFPDKAISYFQNNHKDAHDLAKALLNIAVSDNPRKFLIKSLEKYIAFETFQNPEQISRALSIMEVTNPWPQLNKALVPTRGIKKKGKRPTCKVFLSEFIKRRNDIVHSGDVYVSLKYHGKMKPISRAWVEQSIQKLRKMVLGIEKISQII